MLKHILTGQPSSNAGSRLNHNNDYLHSNNGNTSSSSATASHQRSDHFHNHHQVIQQHLHQQLAARSTRAGSVDVYDSVGHPSASANNQRINGSQFHHRQAITPSAGHRHPLNHSQLSVNNLAQRLNASHHSLGLNLSTLSTSKHSVNSASPVVGSGIPGNGRTVNLGHVPIVTQLHHERDRPKINGGLDISRISRFPSQASPSPAPALLQNTNNTVIPSAPTTTTTTATTSTGPSIMPLNVSWSSSSQKSAEAGIKETLTSLGLLCLVSLLLALLSLTFLLRISPITVSPSSLISPEEYAIVYEVTLVLCAVALLLNLCCLLVCAIQFLFAVKLVKSSYQGYR